jgi:hypothetical protein
MGEQNGHLEAENCLSPLKEIKTDDRPSIECDKPAEGIIDTISL